jgi:hypothetical protein
MFYYVMKCVGKQYHTKGKHCNTYASVHYIYPTYHLNPQKIKILMHINNYLEIRKNLMCICSLHASVHVMNINAPSHKIFQISKYRTFCGGLWSLLAHYVWCHQNIYRVHHNTMLHFLVVHLVNMNTLVRTFTIAVHKNISDKGCAPCTLTTQCIICTLAHYPTDYILFFSASLNRCTGAFMLPRKVTRYVVCPVNLQVAPQAV